MVHKCQEEFNKVPDRKKQKAQLSQTLLALLMYTAITPGRSKEYATLQFEIHRDQLPPYQARRSLNAPNCVHILESGDAAYMAIGDHKTAKYYGCDYIQLETDNPLLMHLRDHVQLYRHILIGHHQHNFLFVVSAPDQHTHNSTHHTHNSIHHTHLREVGSLHVHAVHTDSAYKSGEEIIRQCMHAKNALINKCWYAFEFLQNSRGGPFTVPNWSRYVKSIIFHYTGKRVVPSTLRSSFVTHNEGQALPEDLKRSIATSMRHSRERVSRNVVWCGAGSYLGREYLCLFKASRRECELCLNNNTEP